MAGAVTLNLWNCRLHAVKSDRFALAVATFLGVNIIVDDSVTRGEQA